jgi:uncharacterized protein YjbI with pentapeptide repeats
MRTKPTAQVLSALSPEELRSRYAAGERNFPRINLLRTELEKILGLEVQLDLIEPMYTWLRHYNPLWADFHHTFEQRFEWDSYGSFIPIELDDMPSTRDLSGVDFKEINLEGSYLYPVDLSSSNLHRAKLQRAILHDVDLSHADLSYADLRRTEISGSLRGANLYMARLDRAKLLRCDLRDTNLKRSKLKKADFTGADLRNADLAYAHFDHTILTRSRMKGVDFQHVALHDCHVNSIKIDASQRTGLLKALGI